MCFPNFFHTKTYRHCNVFHVHTNESISNIDAYISLNKFNHHRIIKMFVRHHSQGTTRMTLRNNINFLLPCHSATVHNKCTINMFTTLNRQVKSFSLNSIVYFIKYDLSHIKVRVSADFFTYNFASGTANNE